MTQIAIFNPKTLGKPLGQYSQIARVKASELVFIAGQLSANRDGEIVGNGDFEAQCRQVFANVEVALTAVDAYWPNIVQFTTYMVHSQDISKFMDFRQKVFPSIFPNGLYPPNTLLVVDRLVQEEFLIEVQAIAAI